MPILALAPAAATAFWGAVAGGSMAGASIYGANKQAGAAKTAAQLQVDAANHAADAQAKSAAETLAFQKEQAARDYAMAEANRHANYDQWAAGQQRLGTLGDLIGAGHRQIPAYVPLPANGATPSTSGAAPANATSSLPTINGQGDLASQISAYFKSRGVSDQETPYWVQKWPELVARGQQLGDPTYATKRLAAADVFGGGSAAAASTPRAAYTPTAGSIGSFVPLPMTPALPNPYQPGTLASYAQGH